ncbi:MAG: hypothetical protein O2866_02735 [archaeon]|nr:hypothetical protein [archaeon]MDA0842467.1 hypothetical protein [archaeon]MDA1167782.1 hypothetical protein [archaeon]
MKNESDLLDIFYRNGKKRFGEFSIDAFSRLIKDDVQQLGDFLLMKMSEGGLPNAVEIVVLVLAVEALRQGFFLT